MSVSRLIPSTQDVGTWPPPNFVNPDTRAPFVVGVEVPLTSVAIIFVVARFYSRMTLTVKRKLGWDDWLMLAAVILSTTITAMHCLATRYALGLHIWDIKLAWVTPTWKITYVTMLLLGPTASFTKISLCLTYLKILPSSSDRIFSFSAIIFSIGYCISITAVMTFQCLPISRYWDINVGNSKCIDEPSFHISAQALNSLSDFLIFLWPARTLWRVRIPVKQRLGLIFTFSAGSIVCVAGIVRIFFLVDFFRTYDVYWPGAMIFMLSGIETNIGIICGCLPSIKPILTRFCPNTFGTSVDRSTKNLSHRRLPGARLSLHPDPVPEMSRGPDTDLRCESPYSVEEHEVPIKLDEQFTLPPRAYIASPDPLDDVDMDLVRQARRESTEV